MTRFHCVGPIAWIDRKIICHLKLVTNFSLCLWRLYNLQHRLCFVIHIHLNTTTDTLWTGRVQPVRSLCLVLIAFAYFIILVFFYKWYAKLICKSLKLSAETLIIEFSMTFLCRVPLIMNIGCVFGVFYSILALLIGSRYHFFKLVLIGITGRCHLMFLTGK